ncbi:30S ribosomal protein S20 [Candidatus Roizmanbacteria bacterium CG_4_10_14_0_2_um_filter_39_13]|uniref:Small ribosomal subunit protein bS20 n=1 Tax=Candidatus Roizmanbacteria bacterium CG_4_10_14_0_2_um_filter_39_13 TaxID=1974825 RepID=A0A2M7U0I0_9BACT|nr:MAG: 30S ribosomal protein S20 [Candidatus Roizmanbacteria bacterium CG_4_10_14_0_2_um_filter_39_13]
MPNIKSAIKQMKQDVRRTEENATYMKKVDDVIRTARKGVKTKKNEFVSNAYSLIDKAAKRNVIHGNKASRLKQNVSRLMKKTS